MVLTDSLRLFQFDKIQPIVYVFIVSLTDLLYH